MRYRKDSKTGSPTAAGWYRIAQTADASNPQGNAEFNITERHMTCTFRISGVFNDLEGLNFTLLGRSAHTWTPNVTKVRLLRAGTYDRMYLEIYCVQADTIRYDVMNDQAYYDGWELLDFAAGSIPDGYTAHEYDMTDKVFMSANEDELLNVMKNGQLQLPIQGSAGGLLIGGDVNLYRSGDKELSIGSGLIIAKAGTNYIELGQITDNQYAYIDLKGDATYTDYGLRLLRGNEGPNTYSGLYHRGTGDLRIVTMEAAPIEFWTSNVIKMSLTTAGQLELPIQGSSGGLLIGGDVLLYRSYANDLTLGPDDVLKIDPQSETKVGISTNTCGWGQIGWSGCKLHAGYFDNVPACPLPTIKPNGETALEKIGKIGKPRYERGKRYGPAYVWDAEHLPKEMLYTAPDGSKHPELRRICGFLIQTVIELKNKIDELEARFN